MDRFLSSLLEGALRPGNAMQAAHNFPEDDFFRDTRNIQEPTVKGGGVSTGDFYGSGGASTSGRPQARSSSAEEDPDRPGPSQRPRLNTRNQRKQAQQVGRYTVHCLMLPTSCMSRMPPSNLTASCCKAYLLT